MFHSLDLSASGLIAQRQRMNTIAGNIANLNTTRDAEGNPTPFQRLLISFTPAEPMSGETEHGVGVDYRVEIDKDSQPRMVFEPNHPDANANGYVAFPDINLNVEFVNALEASRAYEANLAAMDLAKQMFQQTLRLIS